MTHDNARALRRGGVESRPDHLGQIGPFSLTATTNVLTTSATDEPLPEELER